MELSLLALGLSVSAQRVRSQGLQVAPSMGV